MLILKVSASSISMQIWWTMVGVATGLDKVGFEVVEVARMDMVIKIPT
jgi:hypothetical protein